VIIV